MIYLISLAQIQKDRFAYMRKDRLELQRWSTRRTKDLGLKVISTVRTVFATVLSSISRVSLHLNFKLLLSCIPSKVKGQQESHYHSGKCSGKRTAKSIAK